MCTSIYAKITLINVNTEEEYRIEIPVNYKDYHKFFYEEHKDEELKIKNININVPLDMSKIMGKGNKPMDFCVNLQMRLQKLNSLSDYDEVSSVIEYLGADTDKIIEFIKGGNFHFYRGADWLKISDNIFDIELERDDEYKISKITQLLKDNGYYKTSTGVLYIPKKDKSCIEKIKNLIYEELY